MARSVLLLLASLGLLVVGCGSTTAVATQTTPPTQAPAQQSTPTPTPNPLILAPATTPSSVGICTQQMSFGADGNASPLLCSDGAVNTLAWTYFNQMYPGIFSIGAYATLSEIQQAVTQLETGGPIPDQESAYCLAKAYYGWQFAISLDPANQVGLPGGSSCSQDVQYFP